MSKKIKLLHVTSSLKIGGAEAVLCDIVRKLGHDQFEHHVIYFHDGPNVGRLASIGAKMYHIKGFAFLYDPIFFARLFFLIKRLTPDVIHSLLWSANVSSRLVAKILKIPHISAYHLDIYDDGVFRNFVDRVTRRMSDYVVAVSDDVAESLGNRNTYKKQVVIKNGIDFDYLHKNVLTSSVKREDVGCSKENFIIGSVGRLHIQKNFPLLLKSFAQVVIVRKNARLVIVGVGSLERDLKDLACYLGVKDKVIFVIGKKACDYYPIFDCFVQSSIKEGLSIALLEAMSFGLPCIVTNSGAAHPVIEHGNNGLIVASENEKSLCDGILQVIDDESLSSDLGSVAKSHVLERFSSKGMIDQYRDLFASFSNRKSP